MTNYTILLPPSERKAQGGEDSKIFRVVKNLKSKNSFQYLDIEREFVHSKVLEAISKADSEEDLENIFELKAKRLQEAVEVTSDILNKRTLPAIQRYTGVMFNAIEYENLSKKQKENFDTSVIFIDGMFGLLKPQDYIPDYKLKITSKILDVNVTKYWKERLVGPLGQLLKNRLVVDLLPEAHRKVVYYNAASEVIQVSFSQMKNDKLSTISHDSKRLKGELIQYICNKDQITRKDLEAFKHSEGYKYSKEHSDDTQIVYLKE